MFLYKPKAKAYSDPVDFYYVPSSQMELKPPLAPAATAQGTMGSPARAAVPRSATNKRTRAPKINPDEESSGNIHKYHIEKPEVSVLKSYS